MLREKFQKLLESVRLDVDYEKGEKNKLYLEGDTNQEITDFVGGFGACFLGHNHPEILAVVENFVKNKRPQFTQGSNKKFSKKLSVKLSELCAGVGNNNKYECILTNTGAETVEAAMKHAELERQTKLRKLQEDLDCKLGELYVVLKKRFDLKKYYDLEQKLREKNREILNSKPIFISLKRAFHGKTISALSITERENHKLNLDKLGVDKIFVDPLEYKSLENYKVEYEQEFTGIKLLESGEFLYESKKMTPFAGFFIEIIQGEGGIRQVEPAALKYFENFCKLNSIPLIADEIQTGLYRTGQFLASQDPNIKINPNYVLLSKSLGAGFSKIGALLIRSINYVHDFSIIQTSTFGEDELSSEVALKNLEILGRNNFELVKSGFEQGENLKQKLFELKIKYPDVIKEVRGKGLMLGIELENFFLANSNSLRIAYDSGKLIPIIAGYLLHEHQIRVMPTMGDQNTIRLEPSAHLSEGEVGKFVKAFETLCQIIRNEDSYCLFRYLFAGEQREVLDRAPSLVLNKDRFQSDSRADSKVGFLVHFPDYECLNRFSDTLKPLRFRERADLVSRFKDSSTPIHMCSRNIKSVVSGKTVNLNGIGITVSSHEIIEAFRNKEYAWLKEIIDESVEKALGMGCQLIGLGQFTSIITRNGTNLKLKEVGVTTGNSLTVASGTDVILSDLKTRKNNQHDRTLAVIGASGNVCEGYLKDLAPHFESIILVGSGRLESEEKLEKIAQRNFRFSRDKSNLKLTQDLKEIINADVIVSATSSTQAIIMPEHIKENALICDLAVPRDVHQRVYKERPDVKVIHGGVVGLPNRDETYLFALPFGAPGIVYACMAESILLGMRQMYDNFSYGDLTADKINHIREIFREEKFELVNKYA